jgi:hypothetical protein
MLVHETSAAVADPRRPGFDSRPGSRYRNITKNELTWPPMEDGEMELISVLQCPDCGVRTEERMPTDACVYFHECLSCGKRVSPRAGHCCVFCSYGSVPCPPIQDQNECR